MDEDDKNVVLLDDDLEDRVALWSQAMMRTTLTLRDNGPHRNNSTSSSAAAAPPPPPPATTMPPPPPSSGGSSREEAAGAVDAAAPTTLTPAFTPQLPNGAGKVSGGSGKKKKNKKKGNSKKKGQSSSISHKAAVAVATTMTTTTTTTTSVEEEDEARRTITPESSPAKHATAVEALDDVIGCRPSSKNGEGEAATATTASAPTEYKLFDSAEKGGGESLTLSTSSSLWSAIKLASPSSSSKSSLHPHPGEYGLLVSGAVAAAAAPPPPEATPQTPSEEKADPPRGKKKYDNVNDDANDNDDDMDEASDIKSTSISHRSLCTGMSVTVASSGMGLDSDYDGMMSSPNIHHLPSLTPHPTGDGKGVDNGEGEAAKNTDATALTAAANAASPRPLRNVRSTSGKDEYGEEIVVHPEELMPPELHRPAPGPGNHLVDGSREELEDAVRGMVATSHDRHHRGKESSHREIVFEPPELAREEEQEEHDDNNNDQQGLDVPSAHSSPSAVRNYFLNHQLPAQPLSPRGLSSPGAIEGKSGLLDTNSVGEEVPVASMNETWCKGLPLSAALLPTDDDEDDNNSDVLSEISDLSDDRSNAYIGLDAALASAKQVYGFNGGQPASPRASTTRPIVAASPSHAPPPPTSPGAPREKRSYEPSVPTFASPRPSHRGSNKGLMLLKAASLRALPTSAEAAHEAMVDPTTFEPTTPSFQSPTRRPPTVVHGHHRDSNRHPPSSLRAFRSKSQRSVYSTASQQTVEIHLDIYVSPIMEDSPALEGLPDRPYVPAELSNTHLQQPLLSSSSRGKGRFRRWTSFRSGRSASKKDLQVKRHNQKNAALRLPMLNINADDESNVSSKESSHLDDIDELEDHLQIEYATEENVLNNGYEERHDLYEKDFLTCPLDDVHARFESRRTAKHEAPQDQLTEAQRTCLANLNSRWVEKYPKLPLSDDMILRFALCAPRGLFHEASAWKKMKRFDRRYLTLTAAGMEKQLRTKTLFPLPGVETKEGNACFYMRPSRYFPKETSVTEIIDNQCYVMSTLMEDARNARNGIGFIANMDNWQFVNFEVKYCFCFMMALQNCAVPTKVTHFLIVNPPTWFGKIWAIMKTMLAPSFQKKVKMIPERYLHLYLKPGFEEYLPDEMESGRADMEDIALEFLAYRKRIEGDSSSSAVRAPNER